jgi:hypothetical protein
MDRSALSTGVVWLERKTDHSAPTSAELKNTWICIFTPQYPFMA